MSISRNLRSSTVNQIFHRFADQIGHNAHHERQLNFTFCTVDLYVVLDLHAGARLRAINFCPLLLIAMMFSIKDAR